MKTLVATIIFFIITGTSFGQNSTIRQMVDSLQHMKADTLDCSADLYWRIVAKGREALPFLFEKLDDTTQTNINFHCKPTKLNVGELAHFAMSEIASFPVAIVAQIQFCLIYPDGCWQFYDYLFDNRNKAGYKKRVKEWYSKNESKFTARKIAEKDRTPCIRQYGISTYYNWNG